MNSIRIEGHFLATSFWHVTEGAEGNETVVMKAKIVSGAHTPDGRAPETPPMISNVALVPSNSIRGRLHRATLSILVEALISRGEFISREAYQMLSNGGMIGGGDSGILTVGEILRARKHVHFGMWGGGPRMMPSSVVTCDLLPVCAETLESGRVPEKFRDFAPMISVGIGSGEARTAERRVASGFMLLSKRMFKRNDDMMSLNQEAADRLAVLGENSAQQVAEYQADQLGHRENRKEVKARTEGQDTRTLSQEDQDAHKKRDLTNFLTMEVVSPGTVWPVDLRMNSHSTAAQVALFARGVENFVNQQRIGSFGRWGFGQFHAFLSVTKDGEQIGHIRWNEAAGKHELVFTEPGFEEALQEELSTITAAEINEFTKNKDTGSGPSDDSKKKKGEKSKPGDMDGSGKSKPSGKDEPAPEAGE